MATDLFAEHAALMDAAGARTVSVSALGSITPVRAALGHVGPETCALARLEHHSAFMYRLRRFFIGFRRPIPVHTQFIDEC